MEAGHKRSSFSDDYKYEALILGQLEQQFKIQSHFGIFDPLFGEGQWYDDSASHALKCMLLLLFVLGLQAVRHAWIMRQCGLEQVCCSNPVPTSDSGQSSPILWVPNLYSLSPTRRSNMHFNDKGQMNGYIGNDNRERNERRTDTGAPISHMGTLSYLACDTRDLVLLY